MLKVLRRKVLRLFKFENDGDDRGGSEQRCTVGEAEGLIDLAKERNYEVTAKPGRIVVKKPTVSVYIEGPDNEIAKLTKYLEALHHPSPHN